MSAWRNAIMACTGGVFGNCPVLSSPSFCTHTSSVYDVELPRHFSRRALRARMTEKPGTPWMHLFAEEIMMSHTSSALNGTAPKDDMASRMIVACGACWRTMRAASWIGLNMPVDVSQWTMAKLVRRAPCSFTKASSAARSIAAPSSDLNRTHSTPIVSQMLAMRAPYEPLVTTATRAPLRGVVVRIAASMPIVPEPCIGTPVHSAGLASPTRTRPLRTSLMHWTKAASRLP
mmetsp:Transcript_5739/g.18021  ORF Transcript_5739/g.18021 Transcript_5739/m.18021 type:complete len:232 (-) Transcript_5739:192-887(-)